MSGMLDRSLDQIMADNKATGGKAATGGRRRNGPRKTKSTAAPAGGVQKNSKPTKATIANKTGKGVKAAPAGESKIIVSKLPIDVSESVIKDFFNKSVGNVKKVLLNYNAAGQSRGQATVIFGKPENAAKALKGFNGVPVDNVPIKIEIVDVEPRPAPKALQDRISQPKAAGKKEKAGVAKSAATNGAAKGKGKKGKSGNAGRPKRKTAEELDAEMQDYFGAGENANGATNGAPAATATADTGMVDEVM